MAAEKPVITAKEMRQLKQHQANKDVKDVVGEILAKFVEHKGMSYAHDITDYVVLVQYRDQ